MSMEISAVLDQMRSVRVAAGSDGVNLPTRLEAPVDFSNLLKESLTEVSKVQKASGDLSLAYASGRAPLLCTADQRDLRGKPRVPAAGILEMFVLEDGESQCEEIPCAMPRAG